MKRKLTRSHSPAARKVACTVSAAALMLGVSHAATVGFNFQTTYCSSPGYSGAIVTATAFGIGTNAWESLTPIQTGYSCGGCGFSNLIEVIDTTTATGGLNPLPNGSLTVSWGAYAANVSGFGGYGSPGPNYTFGGPNEQPGNQQVYWGFLRDGVNFGPVPGTCAFSTGDNNQPGYNVDIVGLKSLFTNTPFVVELVASADSMNVLTNAFVIDATANSTQSVVYPSTPPVPVVGDTPWPRGIGGGLSTVTPIALNTDHLKIIGNRAQHGGSGASGYNNCSCIAGFMITDKPVVTMSPQPPPGPVCPGDTIHFSAYAIGVPPLSFQWRRNGTPIPGANATNYSITLPTNSSALALAGAYDMVVTNIYGRATSAVSTVTIDRIATAAQKNVVLDSSPKGPEHDGLNSGAVWQASNADNNGTNRSGVMSFNAGTSAQITVAPFSSFDSPTGTVMFWMRATMDLTAATNPVALFDRFAGGSNGLVILGYNNGGLDIFAGGNNIFSTTMIGDTNWHHVALSYDQSGFNGLNLYIDGVLDTGSLNPSGNWSWLSSQQIELGRSHNSGYEQFNGLLDDVRMYNRMLTGAEIASVHSSNALVDTNALVLQLNFTAAPSSGIILSWQSTDGILQFAPTASGPWTDLGATEQQYVVLPDKAAQFYRYRAHTPVTYVTNPYLM